MEKDLLNSPTDSPGTPWPIYQSNIGSLSGGDDSVKATPVLPFNNKSMSAGVGASMQGAFNTTLPDLLQNVKEAYKVISAARLTTNQIQRACLDVATQPQTIPGNPKIGP
jgi:hypothetical protein